MSIIDELEKRAEERADVDAAEAAESLAAAARKQLNRATLALDDILAYVADGDCPQPADIQRAARAVRAARGLLRESQSWIRPLAKAIADGRAHAVRMRGAN